MSASCRAGYATAAWCSFSLAMHCAAPRAAPESPAMSRALPEHAALGDDHVLAHWPGPDIAHAPPDETSASLRADLRSVRALLYARRTAVDACWRSELRRDPLTRGAVHVLLALGPGGTVDNVRATSGDLGDGPALPACIERAIRDLRTVRIDTLPAAGLDVEFNYVFEVPDWEYALPERTITLDPLVSGTAASSPPPTDGALAPTRREVELALTVLAPSWQQCIDPRVLIPQSVRLSLDLDPDGSVALSDASSARPRSEPAVACVRHVAELLQLRATRWHTRLYFVLTLRAK